MAYFALLWKARTIENYRLKYEKEKIDSLVLGNAQLEQTLSQRWRLYRLDSKKKISRFFKKLHPDGSVTSNFYLYLMTDQTFPNFLLKSVMGFVGGIILTYLCFMFFVFQLSISLMHATIMSSIIGVLLTLGLAFSYRIRCLVFLLIPQFFSRVGRYTLTCYALVLILTGPATNTLKNSEVLSESMACSQEQIKTSVHQVNDLMKKPINAMKDSLKLMVDQLKTITAKVKETVVRLDRLVLSIVNAFQSSFSWLHSIADICNANLGTPYDRCSNAILDRFSLCQKNMDYEVAEICDVESIIQAACYSVKPFEAFCYATDFMDEAILTSLKNKLINFTEHLRAMFQVEVLIHHSYSYSSNTSRSASQVAAGIVTEISNRADPMLTWLSWSSCVTSLFLLLIIFRAKYYQYMYETRSRFDNCYVTKELQALDLKRQQQGRETVLPLNRRERAKYITPSSFHLVASEKVYLNRSAVFTAITTFKLLIHMIADYSLYWVLMTIRCHGRFQSDLMPGIPHSGAHVSGSGFVARLFSSIIGILDIPLSFPVPSPISCLPDPYPPDLRRYTQIGVLIFLLWFFALFEPYGLRLRHLIMGHYRPERAKARATWLYNHILRTRGSFMKFARRKLHREYKYTSESSLTFRQWISDIVPFQCLRSLFGLGPTQQHCLLCGITSSSDPDSRMTKCQNPSCPGVYCISCFNDIGELCTICLTPADYGDLSDISLEKGSSDDSDSDGELNEGRINENITTNAETDSTQSTRSKEENRRWSFFKQTSGGTGPLDTVALVQTHTYKNKNKRTVFTAFVLKRFQNFKRKVKKHFRVKKRTLDWVDKLARENKLKAFPKEENHKVYSQCLEIEKSGVFNVVTNRTRSIGVNTNRNRGGLVTMIMYSFNRRKAKPRLEQNKAKRDLKKNKKLPMRRIKDHRSESSKRTLSTTKSFHSYNFTIRQRNLKSIVRDNKEKRPKNRMKGYKELKGIISAIRHNSNDIKNISNQNNDNASNNSAAEDRKKITRSSDNANFERKKKNKKKCAKSNKPKRSRKQKDIDKIKTKNSRNRIAEFHQFFSNHWNNFKSSIMPGNAQNRSDLTMLKEKRNHKRRKKQKGVDSNETGIEKCFARKDIKQTRNLRISAFLAELEWTKKDFRGENNIEEENDSFLRGLKEPAPINTDKIIGMAQLTSLPFQRRKAPKTCPCAETCNCKRKRSNSNTKNQSATRLFETLSKQKLTVKKTIDRFRSKVKESLSMVPKVSKSVSGPRGDSVLISESPISVSKHAFVYRSFSPVQSHDSDKINTDLIYENSKYGSNLMQDPSQDIRSNFPEDGSNPSSVQEKDIIVSCSSKSKKENSPSTPNCKCDVYEDLQRKWDHLKLTLLMLKNFCSSLFGPMCDDNTCPSKTKKKGSDGIELKNTTSKCKELLEIGKNAITIKIHKKESLEARIDVGTGIQTPNKSNMETQWSDITEKLKNVMCPPDNGFEAKECRKCTDVNCNLLNMDDENKTYESKEVQWTAISEMGADSSKSANCPEYCHREVQYNLQDARDPLLQITDNKAIGSFPCLCDESCQFSTHELCTCATQDGIRFSKRKHKLFNSLTVNGTRPVSHVNKKTQRQRLFNSLTGNGTRPESQASKKTQHKATPVVADKATCCIGRKHKTDVKAVVPPMDVKLSMESSVILDCHKNVVQPLKEEITDTISDSSTSSTSLKSDGSKTDTTIYSLVTMKYDDTPRSRMFTVNVVTKANQSTSTDKTPVCDNGMVTDDWWSPIVERRANHTFLLEKKKGFNVIERQKKELRKLKGLKELQELKGLQEFREIRKRRNYFGMPTCGRNVSFRSTTQIIPPALLHCKDILSPARYLLESQKYYNEVFATNYHLPPQMAHNYVTQVPKFYEKEKNRSPVGSRRNHQRNKTKRLDECYSPRRQASPRKRKTESMKSTNSPLRKHRQDQQSNNRNAKNSSPKKRV